MKKVLKAENMHCNKCVERITKALTAGGLQYEVSLKDKTVTIDGCEKCLETAKGILDDLGFDAIEMP